MELQVGDQVLIRNMRERGEGTGKLVSHWERQVFKVVDKKPELPVYVIENINKEGDIRTVHRNLLMECNQLPAEVFEKEEPQVRKRVTESKKPQASKKGIQNKAQDKRKHKEIRSDKGQAENIRVEVNKNWKCGMNGYVNRWKL